MTFAVLMLALLAASAGADPAGSDFTITPNNPPNEGQEATFTFVPGPALAGDAVVEWDITDDVEQTGPVATHTYDSPGAATVRMRVTDDEGSEIFETPFTVNGAPVVDFDFNPTSPLPDVEVLFAPNVTDPEGDDVTFAWDFGPTEGTATGLHPRHTYTTPGTRTVTLMATDEHGAVGIQTRQLTVQDPTGPTAAFTISPTVPLVGQVVSFTNTSKASSGSITNAVWDLDNDGEFDDSPDGWSFSTPGSHEVSLRVTQTNTNSAVKELNLRVNAPPTAAFVWSPVGPVAGQATDLFSVSSDSEGALSAQAWDLDGDGQFDDGSGPSASHAFPAAGTVDVGLQVTDSDGVVRSLRRAVTVLPAPAVQASDDEPGFITPFPVVRLAGKVLPRGALVRLLVVRAPRGALVRVSCKGEGCPVRRVRRTSKGGSLRFAQFERRLRVGIRLEIFVRQPQMIGKYTRFLVRAGAPPTRTDRCLFPGDQRPRACP